MYINLAGKEERNRWEIEPTKRKLLIEKIGHLINCPFFPKDEVIEVDFDGLGVTGWDVSKVLEEDFGYKDTQRDDNGWQLDYWIHYHSDTLAYPFTDIVLSGCGMNGEVYLIIAED